jgi:hypothetical protein
MDPAAPLEFRRGRHYILPAMMGDASKTLFFRLTDREVREGCGVGEVEVGKRRDKMGRFGRGKTVS